MPPRRKAPLVRCSWADGGDPLYEAYHDEEWGIPLHDDRALFELLCLEGAQAGLAWITILRKREAYRSAFLGLRPRARGRHERCRARGAADRSRASCATGSRCSRCARTPARSSRSQAEHGSFDSYLWNWVDGEPVRNAWRERGDVPAVTPLAERISKDLKKRGFTFVGPTIIYAYLQAAGVVNDHLVSCFRYDAGPAPGI